MRSLTLALAVLAAPASALEIVELKNGRVIEADKVSVKGDKLRIEKSNPAKNQFIAYTIPLSKVVPEFVYYAWRRQTAADDVQEHLRLAAWCRAHGLYRHALKTYEALANVSDDVKQSLAGLKGMMHEEEATWLFTRAESGFHQGDVKDARKDIERVLKEFADTQEVGRAKELLTILKEREQFLTEQKKQEEIARRARKHKREVDRQIGRIVKADRQVDRANLGRPLDAKRRLRYAAYSYRDASDVFAEMLPQVEVDGLRLTLKALLGDMRDRMITTFLKLADIEYLTGDAGDALNAVHEILALDPGNKAATGLRERILDGGGGRARDDRGYYPGFLWRPRVFLGSYYGGHARVYGIRFGHHR